MVSGDLEPKDKNTESFLIPPGISSQIHSKHGKKDAVAYGSAVQFSEDLDVGYGPARTKPLGLFWSNEFLKKVSRLKPQKQRSKSLRKLLLLPRFQTRARRSSGGTNGPTLLNTPHGGHDGTNRLATLRLNTAQSASTLGGGAHQYASDGRGHSRRQAKGFLLVNDASGKHAGQWFLQHTLFTACTHKTESTVSAKQCFVPAT
ncbi:hypothetical protein E4U19_006328 [Claviceps sp. Clav32 group G5]|nr:hypothetical protein E4U19_006328 [Claviceps sp. Clav32 group G5]